MTSATGFPGKHIYNENKSTITTFGRKSCDIIGDFVNGILAISDNYEPIIHAAGKAHSVPVFQQQRAELYIVNGTRNLLSSIESNRILPKGFVFISSVAVYGVENGCLIKEDAS